jgi:hypothetical protein
MSGLPDRSDRYLRREPPTGCWLTGDSALSRTAGPASVPPASSGAFTGETIGSGLGWPLATKTGWLMPLSRCSWE